MSLARAVISGTLTAEPEQRFTSDNLAVTNLVLSVPPSGPGSSKQPSEPFLVRVTCWRGLSDAAVQTLKKGDVVLVDGKLKINAFQGQDGSQKKQYEIDAGSLSKIPGEIQPIIAAGNPAAQNGASSNFVPAVGANQSSSSAYQQTAPLPQSTSPQSQYAAPQPAAPSAPAGGGFSADDFMTEDDIPF